MIQRLTFPLLFGALTMSVTACGAKVVFDSPGAGGSGGSGQGGSGLSTSNSSGSTSSSSSSSSSSSGEPSPCDQTNDCAKCVNCTVGLVCVDEWAKCQAVQPCMDLLYCLASCQDQQACIDKCLTAYPQGVDLYNLTAKCVICNACYFDCDGAGHGCL